MNTGNKKLITLLLSASLLAIAGCGDSDVPPGNNSGSILDGQPDIAAPGERVDQAEVIPEEYTGVAGSAERIATATLQPTEGHAASGLVAFIQPDANSTNIRIVARLINIPEGSHGFHVHEIGNCSAPDASSAGAHFNPTGTTHGAREGELRHAGDLGNLVATADNVATLDIYDSQLSFSGIHSIIGKAFIVHAGADDLLTQPSGNSGDPIACGVIEMKQGI